MPATTATESRHPTNQPAPATPTRPPSTYTPLHPEQHNRNRLRGIASAPAASPPSSPQPLSSYTCNAEPGEKTSFRLLDLSERVIRVLDMPWCAVALRAKPIGTHSTESKATDIHRAVPLVGTSQLRIPTGMSEHCALRVGRRRWRERPDHSLDANCVHGRSVPSLPGPLRLN